MIKKLWKDLNRPSESYKLASDLNSNQLGYYYFMFEENRVSTGTDQGLIKKFDENGIPINKTYIDVKDKDFVYFPISIGQMGLSIFHTYLDTKNDNEKQRFLKFVDWFYTNAEISEKYGVRWMTDVSLPQYKTPAPWASAFSQARGINILLRGYQLTGKKKYAEMAEKALIPFTISAQDGGVTSFTKWGPFYEEYTSTVPTMVLNGMIFAMCGIFDFVRVFPENTLSLLESCTNICVLILNNFLDFTGLPTRALALASNTNAHALDESALSNDTVISTDLLDSCNS